MQSVSTGNRENARKPKEKLKVLLGFSSSIGNIAKEESSNA